jgi:hypothetical protein
MKAAAEIRIEEWLPNDSRAHASRVADIDADIDMLAEVLTTSRQASFHAMHAVR